MPRAALTASLEHAVAGAARRGMAGALAATFPVYCRLPRKSIGFFEPVWNSRSPKVGNCQIVENGLIIPKKRRIIPMIYRAPEVQEVDVDMAAESLYFDINVIC